MTEWEELLGIRWPRNACDRSGECCRGAAQITPWRNILLLAARGDGTARAFLSQYVPYPNTETARQHAPHGVAASMEIATARGDDISELVFYRCRYLQNQGDCQIYEDRPQLCRDFPESPFGAVPACCGYFKATTECRDKAAELRRQLATLKKQSDAPE